MVAKFVSVDDFAIRSGLGLVDDLAEEVQTKARYAIEAATTHLVSIIRTDFDEAAGIVDRFYVDTDEMPYVGEFPRLYLSRGFVTTAVSSLSVKAASILTELSGGTALNTDYLVLDATKGTLLITGTDELPIAGPSIVSGDRFFAQVTYDAGFAQSADAFGFIYEGAPDWLKEAAMILAKSIFDTGAPCADKDRNAQGCPCSIEGLVSRYIRFAPSAIKPMS